MKIGIMGGTFNPAHEGHRYISTEAIKRFGLDKVIWFVTPQNPLKAANVQNSLPERLAKSKEVANRKDILVTDFETHLPNTYTITLIKRLKKMYPNAQFCWIMGADNLVHFHKWRKWKEIVKLVPILIFDREYYHKSLNSSRMIENFDHGIVVRASKGNLDAHSWYFVKLRKNEQSSTKLRNEQNKKRK